MLAFLSFHFFLCNYGREKERDRKLYRPIVALFKYEKKGRERMERIEQEREIEREQDNAAFFFYSTYSIIRLFEKRRQSFHK